MARLEGKVAIVTGAASGIGRATARLLADAGASVLAADANASEGSATAAAIESAGGKSTFFEVDLTVDRRVEAMVDAAVETFGRLDILHNNAGIMPMHDSIEDVSKSDWDLVLDVLLNCHFVASKRAFPIMREQGSGVIVNTSSYGAYMPLAWGLPYAAAKAGVLGFSRSLAALGRPHGIRCVVVSPYAAKTNLQAESSDAVKAHVAHIGLPPEAIAAAVLYAASEDSMTGEELLVKHREDDEGQPVVPAEPVYFRAGPVQWEELSDSDAIAGLISVEGVR